jgi:hypothetical protein
MYIYGHYAGSRRKWFAYAHLDHGKAGARWVLVGGLKSDEGGK